MAIDRPGIRPRRPPLTLASLPTLKANPLVRMHPPMGSRAVAGRSWESGGVGSEARCSLIVSRLGHQAIGLTASYWQEKEWVPWAVTATWVAPDRPPGTRTS